MDGEKEWMEGRNRKAGRKEGERRRGRGEPRSQGKQGSRNEEKKERKPLPKSPSLSSLAGPPVVPPRHLYQPKCLEQGWGSRGSWWRFFSLNVHSGMISLTQKIRVAPRTSDGLSKRGIKKEHIYKDM